ncbi:lipoyl synthase [candidate division WOR-3 bacterium]|nr:lipoyl synthase [candidate division WOR-3 bacterium]
MEERIPQWLKRKAFLSELSLETSKIISLKNLNTVCREAKCPNREECYSKKTATFMILGRVCTRNCAFCGVESGTPGPVDDKEPLRLAKAAEELGLDYVVITSVTRDDLPDGGAGIFSEAINEVKNSEKKPGVEVLIPDFKGDRNSLLNVLSARPNVLNHNIETVPSLYRKIRPGANYIRSLDVIQYSKKMGLITKTGLIVGMGESFAELQEVFKDIVSSGADILTVGQYMKPSKNNLPVQRYLRPEEFELIEQMALDAGLKAVLSGPLVRSSYRAKEYYEKIRNI